MLKALAVVFASAVFNPVLAVLGLSVLDSFLCLAGVEVEYLILLPFPPNIALFLSF